MYMLIIFIILLFDIETITVTETFIKENLEKTISFFSGLEKYCLAVLISKV